MKPHNNTKITFKALALAFTLSLLTACGGGSGDDEETAGTEGGEGGIIGTAKIIVKSDNKVNAKSKAGNTYNATIDSNGKYKFTKVASGSYLLKTKNGSNNLYSIAYVSKGKTITSNVHPLTDLIIRNWFATHNLDIDKQFKGTNPIAKLPSIKEVNAIETAIEGIVAQLLKDSGIKDGVNLISQSFDLSSKDKFNKFLDSNKVVINNGQVTLIFNQNTGSGIQNISINGISIKTDFLKDNEAPSTPTNLRALPADTHEIVVVWEASKDNRGVAGYKVYRNGTFVTTTPYPVFSDTNLSPNTNYDYSVEAIDGAGNTSAKQNSKVVTTLSSPDTQAPPAIAGLNATASNDDIALQWNLTQVNDIARFIVKRGLQYAAKTEIASITANTYNDFNLANGNYCYSVIAVDAAGNKSTESDEVCVEVTSSNDGGNNPPPKLVKPSRPTSCTTLGFTTIDQDMTLDKPCYTIINDLTVNARLIIKPGVWIEFTEGTKLQIDEKGSLYSVGTTTQPIVFTGKQFISGYWTGIKYNYSKSVNNKMEYTFVEYAEINIDTYGIGTSYPVRLNIKNSILQNASNLGLHINNKHNLIDDFSNNIVTKNGRGISLPANLVGSLDKNSSYKGNTDDLIRVFNEAISNDQTWKKLDVDYFLWSRGVNYNIDADLTLEAGVKLVFNEGVGLNINEYGSLKAVGASNKKIILTGFQEIPGYWRGVKYFYSKNANNKMNHVIIEYGENNIDTYAIGATYPVWLNIKNTIIQNASNIGMHLQSEHVKLLGFQNNKIIGNMIGVILPAELVGSLDKSSTYSGNTDDRIHVFNTAVDFDQTWKNLDVDYFMLTRQGSYNINSDLVIEAGVKLIFQAGAGLNINESGSLKAVGTSNSNIIFTGLQKVPGYWNSLKFNYSNNVLNILDYVHVEYAGLADGNIRTVCIGTSYPNKLIIKNSKITDSATWGIYNGGSSCQLTQSNNDFSNNVKGSIKWLN